eukprot:TRINITY_DN13372_c0_g1_i1.p1 TRINITY_DN13372_c0_g1~~TRINITY_DN13372_c0_g1_i1.p1  ORF type:complete len:434 (+),score=21.39 TRINITY_DN13372_c0_g1_i1:99-1400(+)
MPKQAGGASTQPAAVGPPKDGPPPSGRAPELFLFIFLVVHLWLQNYNVYRSNFVVDNLHLLLFSIVALSRRLFLSNLSNSNDNGQRLFSDADSRILAAAEASISRRVSWWPFSLQNTLHIAIFFCFGVYFFVRAVSKHAVKHGLLLLLPYAGYAVLFAWQFRSLRRTGTADDLQKLSSIAGPGHGAGASESSSTSSAAAGSRPQQRSAHLLNSENLFLDQLSDAFCAVFETSCISALLPFIVLQNEYLLFETRQCVTLLVYVALSVSITFFCRILSTDFYERFIRSRYLGFWQLRAEKTAATSPASSGTWSASQVYPAGSEVLHNGFVFVAKGDTNTAEPGSLLQQFFHTIYAYPERTHTSLIGIQLAVTISLLILVVRTSRDWSIYAVSLGFNYYLLWKCILLRRQNLRILSARTAPPSGEPQIAAGKRRKE